MSLLVEAWMPKPVILLRQYSYDKFISDLIAGVTAGLVAMAFAIASGVPPLKKKVPR